MFSRPAGWIKLTAYERTVNHFFHADQTKALCGASQSDTRVTAPEPDGYICGKCAKFMAINKIPKAPRKFRDSPWGGLKR